MSLIRQKNEEKESCCAFLFPFLFVAFGYDFFFGIPKNEIMTNKKLPAMWGEEVPIV